MKRNGEKRLNVGTTSTSSDADPNLKYPAAISTDSVNLPDVTKVEETPAESGRKSSVTFAAGTAPEEEDLHATLRAAETEQRYNPIRESLFRRSTLRKDDSRYAGNLVDFFRDIKVRDGKDHTACAGRGRRRI